MHPPTVRRQRKQGLTQGAQACWRWLAQALRPLMARCLGPWIGPGIAFVLALVVSAGAAMAQGVELATLQTHRRDNALELEFAARVTLPRAVEDALQRGVPIYFVAEASLLRGRWYWRDERVSRVTRSWRVAYQPLTNSWRVGLGGLTQSYATLPEALSAASRSAGWRLAELKDLDPDKSYYVEFNYRLDTTQLPGPMQFGLGGQSEWAVGAQRTLKVDLAASAPPQ